MLTNNPGEVAEALNHYFIDSVAAIAQCFSPEDTNVCPVNTMEPAFSIRNVTESEVARIIRSLKPSRAKDIFGMDAVMLKELSTTLTNPITKIINLSISQGMFPSDWKLLLPQYLNVEIPFLPVITGLSVSYLQYQRLQRKWWLNKSSAI